MKPNLKPCVSCGQLVPEITQPPYTGHRKDCALVKEWVDEESDEPDYAAAAAIVREYRVGPPPGGHHWDLVESAFVEFFRGKNPAFDVSAFRKSCEPSRGVGQFYARQVNVDGLPTYVRFDTRAARDYWWKQDTVNRFLVATNARVVQAMHDRGVTWRRIDGVSYAVEPG